jgi:hypothetical protein
LSGLGHYQAYIFFIVTPVQKCAIGMLSPLTVRKYSGYHTSWDCRVLVRLYIIRFHFDVF